MAIANDQTATSIWAAAPQNSAQRLKSEETPRGASAVCEPQSHLNAHNC